MIDLGRLTARRGGAVCLLLLGTIYLVARRNADGGFPAAQADSGIELEGPHPRSDLPGWDERHEDYVALAEAARKQKGYEVVIYGDSITESFYGGFVGMQMANYTANAGFWKKMMLPKHRAVVFSIAGDRIAHLLWRMRHGEGLTGLNPKAVMVLIGTNDVSVAKVHGDGERSEAQAARVVNAGVQEVVREVRSQARGAAIVVLALPPLQPVLRSGVQLHNLQGTVDAVNGQMRNWTQAWGHRSRPPLVFQDCSGLFLNADRDLILERIPDGVHPQGPGAAMLLNCMLEGLDKALGAGRRRRLLTLRREKAVCP